MFWFLKIWKKEIMKGEKVEKISEYSEFQTEFSPKLRKELDEWKANIVVKTSLGLDGLGTLSGVCYYLAKKEWIKRLIKINWSCCLN